MLDAFVARVGRDGAKIAEQRARIEADTARIARLVEALRIFTGCAYPVADEINPRGHNRSEAYLDQALTNARAVLDGMKEGR
jgi:hypothetical protein